MTGDSRIAPTIKKEKTNKTAGRQWQPLQLKIIVILHQNVGGTIGLPFFLQKEYFVGDGAHDVPQKNKNAPIGRLTALWGVLFLLFYGVFVPDSSSKPSR